MHFAGTTCNLGSRKVVPFFSSANFLSKPFIMKRRAFLSLAQKHQSQAKAPRLLQEIRKSEFQNPAETGGISFQLPPRPPVVAGLDPFTGTWTVAQAAHLLRRTMFGATWQDVQRVLSLGMNAAVDLLLQTPDPGDEPANPVNDYNNDDVTDPEVPFGEDWTEASWSVDTEFYKTWSLKSWWMRNIIGQKISIHEKMVLFWHNHIPVQMDDIFFARRSFKYLKLLRRHALGNFKTLIKDITLDPAMLQYLNGQENSAQQPDENYARELQELFCIGKGPEAKFTEGDVQAMARVLTGHRARFDNDDYFFAYWEHDGTDKQLSAFYNNAVITGRSGVAGAEELDDLLDVIFDNDETALFLCRKLYRFFVYHDIDATTEQNVIQPMAQIFRDNNYEILPVLDALFRSQHFYENLNLGVVIKSGLDFQLGSARELKLTLPPPAELTENWQIFSQYIYVSALLQHYIGDPPNVSGWAAYYQIPQFDKHWITTDTLPRRIQIGDGLIFAGISSENYTAAFDLVAVTKNFPDPADPNKLISDVLSWMFPIAVSPGVSFVLKSILLSGQVSDHYWSDAWNDHINNPDDEMKFEIVNARLKGFYYYLLHLEEYHLS